jgi:hypothetical protein
MKTTIKDVPFYSMILSCRNDLLSSLIFEIRHAQSRARKSQEEKWRQESARYLSLSLSLVRGSDTTQPSFQNILWHTNRRIHQEQNFPNSSSSSSFSLLSFVMYSHTHISLMCPSNREEFRLFKSKYTKQECVSFNFIPSAIEKTSKRKRARGKTYF